MTQATESTMTICEQCGRQTEDIYVTHRGRHCAACYERIVTRETREETFKIQYRDRLIAGAYESVPYHYRELRLSGNGSRSNTRGI